MAYGAEGLDFVIKTFSTPGNDIIPKSFMLFTLDALLDTIYIVVNI